MRITRARVAIALLAVVVLGSPEIVYRAILLDIAELPEKVEPLDPAQREVGWINLGGKGPPELAPLHPWQFWRICVDECKEPGLTGADFVAELHILYLHESGLQPRGSALREWLRETALTIWISRHWTVDEVMAYAYRAFANPPPPSRAERP